MNYKCTRNQNSQVTAAQAIVQGIAKDGGLFVPETLPQYTHKDFVEMQNGTYIDRAIKVLSDFFLVVVRPRFVNKIYRYNHRLSYYTKRTL